MVQDTFVSPVPPQQTGAAFRRNQMQRSTIVPVQNNSTIVPRPPTAVAPSTVSCECHCHNSGSVASNNAPLVVVLKEAGHNDVSVPIDFFPMTTALRSVIESAEKGATTVEISVRQFCKLYDEGKCRHRQRCKNIHLCPTKKAEISAAQKEEAALAAVTNVLQKKPSFVEERPTMSTSPMPHPPKCESPKSGATTARPFRRSSTNVVSDSNPTTKCLARFIRRWNNPNIANSGDSNLSLSAVSITADSVSESRSSIPKLPPIFQMRESFTCSSPAVMAMLRTPTPADERDECGFLAVVC